MNIEWYNTTCVGDQIETEMKLGTDIYRWRMARIKLPGENRFDGYYDSSPWIQTPIPENLKPRWMRIAEYVAP